MASNSAILLAAGSGSRMQGTVDDKVLAPLAGEAVIVHSARAFIQSGVTQQLTIVFRDEAQRAQIEAALQPLDCTAIYVPGGKERQDSVFNALKAQPKDCAYVFIHDCARPLITADAIQALHMAVQRDRAAVLAHPVADTIKRIPSAGQLAQTELEDLERPRLWAMETPQAFAYADILKAYRHVRDNGLSITDDTAAAATIGLKTTIVPNTQPNPKITTPADLDYIEWRRRRRLRGLEH